MIKYFALFSKLPVLPPLTNWLPFFSLVLEIDTLILQLGGLFSLIFRKGKRRQFYPRTGQYINRFCLGYWHFTKLKCSSYRNGKLILFLFVWPVLVE